MEQPPSINNPPSNFGVLPESAVEDTNLAITTISVTDSDAFLSPISVILSVDHGTLDIRTDVAGGVRANEVTGDATGTVTLIASQQEIDATLAASNGLIYRGALNFNGVDTLTVTSNDLGSSGFTIGSPQDIVSQATITVSPVNDSPVFGHAGPTGSSAAGIASVLDHDLTVSDVDLDARNGGAGNYAGTSFTVERQTAPNANDVFGFSTAGTNFVVNGGNLLFGGLTFATFSNSGGALSISFTSSATAATTALVDQVLQHITYENNAAVPPNTATLAYTFNDGAPGDGQGSGATSLANATINVAISDPAVANDDFFETDTGGSSSLFDNDTDPRGNPFSVIAVSGGTVGHQFTLPSGATLQLNSDGTFDYQVNHAFDYLPGPDSGASNLTADDTFTYTITGGSTATVTITVEGIEGGNDLLLGTAVADTLLAGASNDTLEGLGGADLLTGGGGADTFVFGNAAYASATGAPPVIAEVVDFDQGNAPGFDSAEGDRLDLSRLLGAAFAGGDPASTLVRIVEGAGQTFATLQVDIDGAQNGSNFVTIAKLDGVHAGDTLDVILDASPLASTSVTSVACYCAGTLILTDRGEVAVETLQIGDGVMTMNGAIRPIKWIGKRSYSGRFALGQKHILPVRIKAGALDENTPRRDLWISPHHAMYLQGVLIEAKDLVNDISIVQVERVEKVEYFHIELDSHDVIIAEGALSETFVDDDSRGMFHNAREYALHYPEEQHQDVRYCAPRSDSGYAIEAARQRIEARAGLRAANDAGALALLGNIDRVGSGLIEGWAQNPDYPEAPVCLDIYVGDRKIGQTLANRYREDLKQAGLGSGRHSFMFASPCGVDISAGFVNVRRSVDGAKINASASAKGVKRHLQVGQPIRRVGFG